MNITKQTKKMEKTLAKQAQAQAKAIDQARSHTTAMREALVQAISDYQVAVRYEQDLIAMINHSLTSRRKLGEIEMNIARLQDVVVDTVDETLDLIDEYNLGSDMVDIDEVDDNANTVDVDESDFDGEVVE